MKKSELVLLLKQAAASRPHVPVAADAKAALKDVESPPADRTPAPSTPPPVAKKHYPTPAEVEKYTREHPYHVGLKGRLPNKPLKIAPATGTGASGAKVGTVLVQGMEKEESGLGKLASAIATKFIHKAASQHAAVSQPLLVAQQIARDALSRLNNNKQ